MDKCLILQLRDRVISDLQEHIPDGYFSSAWEDYSVSYADTLRGKKPKNQGLAGSLAIIEREINCLPCVEPGLIEDAHWYILARSLAGTILENRKTPITPRQRCAAGVLICLALLEESEVYSVMLESVDGLEDLWDKRNRTFSHRMLERKVEGRPVVIRKFHERLPQYLHHLRVISPEEAELFDKLLQPVEELPTLLRDNSVIRKKGAPAKNITPLAEREEELKSAVKEIANKFQEEKGRQPIKDNVIAELEKIPGWDYKSSVLDRAIKASWWKSL